MSRDCNHSMGSSRACRGDEANTQTDTTGDAIQMAVSEVKQRILGQRLWEAAVEAANANTPVNESDVTV